MVFLGRRLFLCLLGSVSTEDAHASTPSGGQSEGGKNLGPLDSLAGDVSHLSIANTTTNSTAGE